jgi:hypothetical protein
VGAFCININSIEGLACSHEQAIALGSTKADIRTDFGKKNLANTNAIGRKDMHTIVPSEYFAPSESIVGHTTDVTTTERTIHYPPSDNPHAVAQYS